MKNTIAMVSEAHLTQKDVLGVRIESGSFYGTVRYIGTLPDHPGTWYGIEWDDPGRGKHNGTVNGVQYFITKHPTSGSFVRREKINFGKRLIDAIIAKYGAQECEIVKKLNNQQLLNLQKSIKAPFIEFVGFDKVSTKQSNFESLLVVSAREQIVSWISQPFELQSLCPNIQEIDLSKNLLNSWEDIFNVCDQLEHLHWLNVSENILEFPESCDYTFPNITVFICGNMKLTWEHVKKLSKIFLNINELRANNNCITDLTTEKINSFKNLEVLDLEENPLKGWSEIVKLKSISSLQHLSLGGVGLEKIDFRTEELKIDYFENLFKLCISDNPINDWKSVSELNKIPNLEELKFRNAPILSTEPSETSEQIVIAKIASLKMYNGRKINSDDRRGAEFDYQKKYGLEWLRVKNTASRAKFIQEHNRYLDLIDMHGELEEGELKVPDTLLKHTLINLNLVSGSRTVSKKVAPSMLVQKLKILVQKLFKLPERPDLVCVNSQDSIQIVLDDDLKEVGYFSVKNDDTIIAKV